MFSTEKHQTDRISRMESLRNHVNLLDASFESRRGAVAMLHAEGGIQGDHYSYATLADPRGYALRIFHERFRESEGQQQDREATEAQQQDVPQANLPRADPHASIEKLHRRPVGAFHLIAAEQVGQESAIQSLNQQ